MARDKKPQLGELVGGPDFCHSSSGIPAEEAGAKLSVSKVKIRDTLAKKTVVFFERFIGDPLAGDAHYLKSPYSKGLLPLNSSRWFARNI